MKVDKIENKIKQFINLLNDKNATEQQKSDLFNKVISVENKEYTNYAMQVWGVYPFQATYEDFKSKILENGVYMIEGELYLFIINYMVASNKYILSYKIPLANATLFSKGDKFTSKHYTNGGIYKISKVHKDNSYDLVEYFTENFAMRITSQELIKNFYYINGNSPKDNIDFEKELEVM